LSCGQFSIGEERPNDCRDGVDFLRGEAVGFAAGRTSIVGRDASGVGVGVGVGVGFDAGGAASLGAGAGVGV